MEAQSESCMKTKMTTRLESTFMRWFLWWPGGEAGCVSKAKGTQGKADKGLQAVKGTTGGSNGQPKQERQQILFPGDDEAV